MDPQVPANIRGHNVLVAKRSAVDSNGALRVEPIDGIKVRLTRPVPHEDGHVIEIARRPASRVGASSFQHGSAVRRARPGEDCGL
jgi:hypothetical protein